MLHELLKEEIKAIEDFYDILNRNEVVRSDETSNFDYKIIEEAVERSRHALKECQLIESLDQQLRRLTRTIETLKKIKRIKELEERILEEKNFALLLPMISEWRSENDGLVNVQVKIFVNETLPEIIDKEIQTVLSSWIDNPPTSIDKDSFEIVRPFLQANPNNPLPGLFASFPSSKLKILLFYQNQLGNLERLKKSYSDRLLNRFYNILSDSKQSGPGPSGSSGAFSVGLIETLVSEKMKFATRISCILEATNYFIILHEKVIEIKEILLEKCGQILRQIRRDAKKERNGYSGELEESSVSTGNNVGFAFDAFTALAAFSFKSSQAEPTVPVNNLAQIDSQLNEICLIISSLSGSSFIEESIILTSELEKWKLIHCQLEEFYLFKGIQRAIEMDQIVVNSDYPVSSCVDDIFYILKASQKRSQDGNLVYLVPRALKEFFLSVLRRHLELTLQSLKPVQNLDSSNFKPSRDLISTLVLLNNIVTIKSYWHQGSFKSTGGGAIDIDRDLEDLFELALKEGLYGKVLRKDFVLKELKKCSGNGEELFIKIHSILLGIYNIFKSSLAKNALDQLLTLCISDFSQDFCKILLDNPCNTSSLRYDRLLHEFTQWLDTIGYSSSTTSTGLDRLRQIIALVLVESKIEAQELVDEWKKENQCQLRAGEILLILNRLK